MHETSSNFCPLLSKCNFPERTNNSLGSIFCISTYFYILLLHTSPYFYFYIHYLSRSRSRHILAGAAGTLLGAGAGIVFRRRSRPNFARLRIPAVRCQNQAAFFQLGKLLPAFARAVTSPRYASDSAGLLCWARAPPAEWAAAEGARQTDWGRVGVRRCQGYR